MQQQTLLNLGANFLLPRDQWPQLCSRIDDIITGQLSFAGKLSEEAEEIAQNTAAQLIAKRSDSHRETASQEPPDYQEVDLSSVEQLRPRSIGVEHVAFEAIKSLNIPKTLESVGFNKVQRDVAVATIIARMAAPASESATWQWMNKQSGIGELLDVNFESMSAMRLYRVSDLLVKHRRQIEETLFSNITDLFSLEATVTLYDLTNTFFEGAATDNEKAQRGHSKEKRTDCPLVTLGLILDGSGFVQASEMFEGNVSEAGTLQTMLDKLNAPKGALVVMDRGIATQANVEWLIENEYRYLVASKERTRHFDPEDAVEITTASDQVIKAQRVLNEDKSEARLYCYSELRKKKEEAMAKRLTERFESGLQKISASLEKRFGTKAHNKVLERIGRLKEKSKGIGQHYEIELSFDETGRTAVGLRWQRKPVEGSRLTHPGVYCLRTNVLEWNEERLWQTYTMLTDIEAVFRSLKSELGLRPVYHHKEERADGHLFITVLAYQATQVIRRKLKEHGINDSWMSLRAVFSRQQRVTARFKQRNGDTLHVRNTTIAEGELQKLYDVLGITSIPIGTKKTRFNKMKGM